MSKIHSVQQLKTDLPFQLAVASGKVPGWRWLRKFGMNDAINGSSTTEDMWPPGTPRVLPSTAAVAIATSDDGNDDGNPASTGAIQIVIQGLDENFDEIEETLVLEGLSNATTTLEFLRINRAYVDTSGSTETNEGNISITIGGALQAYIEALEGQTHQTLYTVPAGHTWIIADYQLKSGRMSGSSDLQIVGAVKLEGKSWRVISDIYMYSADNWQSSTDGATVIPAKTEVRVQVVSSGATQAVAVAAGYLVDNNYL